jgi:hydrogenase expression/formation protein HypE
MIEESSFGLSCPRSSQTEDRILLGHGGGGQLSHNLIKERISRLYQDSADLLHDSAVFSASTSRLAFTTDSFVVNPLFFPGGDIGSLSVYGTANDLAMSGARPEFLSIAFIIEEGFPFAALDRILDSIREAAHISGIRCVTGDTKVVERGNGDGIFINTSGIGSLREGLSIHPTRIEAGDAILLNGDVGRHGVAIMGARNQGLFQASVRSDCACLYPVVEALLDAGVDIHCLRDLTRGGLAAALNELAEASQLGVLISEEQIPIDPEVNSCCEILGLDPLALANEGRFICILPESQVAKALDVMSRYQDRYCADSIGHFVRESPGYVRLRSAWATERLLLMPSGEQLPRIC